MSRTPVPTRDVVRLRVLRSPQGLALPNSCPRGHRRGCRRPRPTRRAAAIHHPAETPAMTGSSARRAARHLPNARNRGRSRPETPGGAGRNRPGLAGMVREYLGYSRVLAGLDEPVRAGIASPPRFTVPGGARRRARSPPCLVALASRPGNPALTRYLNSSCSLLGTQADRAGRAVRPCRERRTKLGGSSHNSGRPRRRTPGTPHIP
jgi:hypothetical protein